MKIGEMRYPESIISTMIAPCGMNCVLCMGYLRDLREKNHCLGCHDDAANLPKSCAMCIIRNCVEFSTGEKSFCYECAKFPCLRLRQLDKRYRTKYGMSMIANLESIQEIGLEAFVAHERDRWKCPECGGVICVHRTNCIFCGHPRD